MLFNAKSNPTTNGGLKIMKAPVKVPFVTILGNSEHVSAGKRVLKRNDKASDTLHRLFSNKNLFA